MFIIRSGDPDQYCGPRGESPNFPTVPSPDVLLLGAFPVYHWTAREMDKESSASVEYKVEEEVVDTKRLD